MKINANIPRLRVLALCLLVLSAGCYHGAVFTQYQRFGMQLKADPKTGVPVKASVGYVHGTSAVVPKEDIDSTPPQGEIGSMIAKNEVVATLPRINKVVLAAEKQLARWRTEEEKFQDRLATANALFGANENAKKVIDALKPKEPSSAQEATEAFRYDLDAADADKPGQRLLHARSYFIGGVAALVASMPKDKYVIIKQDAATNLAIRLQGSPAQRISAAIKAGTSPQQEISRAFYEIEALPEDIQPAAYELAALYINEDEFVYEGKTRKFIEVFNELKAERGPEDAFVWLTIFYLGDKLEGPKHQLMQAATRAACERYKTKEISQ